LTLRYPGVVAGLVGASKGCSLLRLLPLLKPLWVTAKRKAQAGEGAKATGD